MFRLKARLGSYVMWVGWKKLQKDLNEILMEINEVKIECNFCGFEYFSMGNVLILMGSLK